MGREPADGGWEGGGLERTVRVPVGPERLAVLGPAERHLKMIREVLGVHVTAREDEVRVRGAPEAVEVAGRVLTQLARVRGPTPTRERVLGLIASETERARAETSAVWRAGEAHGAAPGVASGAADGGGPIGWEGDLDVHASGRGTVRPLTEGQSAYVEAIRAHDLVLAIGPAGTGKTYLAVAAAVHLLAAGRVRRLVLVRPAVEAGERLGFLPGDPAEKIHPYLRPLFDALGAMVDHGTLRRYLERDVIELAPLAYMRGRTLDDAVVILDEAQNTTRTQMRMFLTRMGRGSKMIVTGDVSQVDLPEPDDSGLIDATHRLGAVEGVAVVRLEGVDVVRHPLVQRVIEAYAEPGASAGHGAGGRGPSLSVAANGKDG